MGGDGGRGPRKDELEHLEELARQALRQSEDSTKRNVFISFATEDMDEVNLLRAQAKNENSDLEFNDWSLREPFESKRAEYIKKGIKERIERSSVTLVYISPITANSNWVDWEIRESIKLGKGVIAVHTGDSPPSQVPSAIIEHKIPVIKWTASGIATAIENAIKGR